MRRLLLTAVLTSALAGWAITAEIKTGPLAPGKNVPGTFHPYNVTARIVVKEEPDEDDKKAQPKSLEYTTKGKYHCLVTEYDLDPVIMLFAHGLEKNEAFGKLLEQIDGAIDRNPAVRLRAFVVFIDTDIPSIAEDDDKREARDRTITKLAETLKLRHVVLTLAGKNDLPRYPIDERVPLTAVMYRNLRILSSRTLSAADLDKPETAELKAVLADVKDKMKATR